MKELLQMFNFNGIVAKAKNAQAEMKAKFGDEVTESRFIIQFKNLQTYQYKINPENMKKLAKLDYADVIMVQLVTGDMEKTTRGAKFRLRGLRILETVQDYEEKIAEVDAGHELSWS